MKLCIIFFFLLITIAIDAQTADKVKDETDSISKTKLTGETWFEQKGYIGEQFFNKTWMSSDLLLSTGDMIYNEKVKYNGLLDDLIWVNSSINQQFKLDKPLIKEFWLKNEQGQFTHFKQLEINNPTSTNQMTNVFAELDVEGKISLYIQRKISVVNTDEVTIDGILCQQETIKPTPQYYLKLDSNDYVLLKKMKLESFLKLLPNQKKQINIVMRNNKLKLKTEKDLIKLIKLLNAQGI